jgi:O-antigen biosynthesis protein WbqV
LRQNLPRAAAVFLHDLVMAALSFPIALYLRVGDRALDYLGNGLWPAYALFVLVSGLVFLWLGTYRGVWRYVSTRDLLALLRAVTLILLVFLPLLFLWTRLAEMPRSVLVIDWFVLTGLLVGPRLAYRLSKGGRLDLAGGRGGQRRVPVLLLGAGDGAELFIRAMGESQAAPYRVIGLLDEKGSRIGRDIHGVPVMGGPEQLDEVVARCARRGETPQRVIVTKEHLDPALLRQLLERAEALGLTLARMPRLTDLKAGLTEGAETHAIAIEDLLGRPQAVLDRAAMAAMVAGRRVLVTGAGGTIGSELVRQIAELDPAALVLVDHGEFELYRIERELIERKPGLPRRALLCDVRDGGRVQALLAVQRPELVFHAAALKHVPIVEAQPSEGVLTNLIGTRNLADACQAAGVTAMVLISTDKAVNPSSVMGATKRAAESYCQARDIASASGGHSPSGHLAGSRGGTRYITVRFGNVLGSTGSVVPLFQRQIEQGGPVTVTHPEMARYFMTTREAVELVLQAAALGGGPGIEGGKIFVLDMGEPVRILALARQMIRLAGFRPDEDIRIEFTGLRPGEKLNEELLHESEALVPTRCPGILLAAPRTADLALLSRAIEEIGEAAAAGRDEQAVTLLERLVPEYRRGADGMDRAVGAR